MFPASAYHAVLPRLPGADEMVRLADVVFLQTFRGNRT